MKNECCVSCFRLCIPLHASCAVADPLLCLFACVYAWMDNVSVYLSGCTLSFTRWCGALWWFLLLVTVYKKSCTHVQVRNGSTLRVQSSKTRARHRIELFHSGAHLQSAKLCQTQRTSCPVACLPQGPSVSCCVFPHFPLPHCDRFVARVQSMDVWDSFPHVAELLLPRQVPRQHQVC